MIDAEPLHVKAQRFVGMDETGALADRDLRQRVVRNYMAAHKLTAQRITDEAAGRVEASAAASILKNSNTRVAQNKAELALEIMGSQGVGWSGDDFAEDELGIVREWLSGKAMSIYGGSYEVQNNIISMFWVCPKPPKRIDNGSVNRRTIHIEDQALWSRLICPCRSSASSNSNSDGVDLTLSAMVDMGWTGILVPESYGGSELGYLTFGVILEQLGRQLCASPLFASAYVGATAINLGASDAQKQHCCRRSSMAAKY